jgi:hypothetical protein
MRLTPTVIHCNNRPWRSPSQQSPKRQRGVRVVSKTASERRPALRLIHRDPGKPLANPNRNHYKRNTCQGDNVQKKCGKFFADWRDEKGVRHRKAFETAAQASKYARRMRNQAATKKAPASAHSARSRRRGKQAGRKAPRTMRSARKSARRGRPSARTS